MKAKRHTEALRNSATMLDGTGGHVNTKTLIWRGSSSDVLSDKSDKNIKNLDKGVQKLFDHFPPDLKK